MLDSLRDVAGNLTTLGDFGGSTVAEEVVALAGVGVSVTEANAFTRAWFLDPSSTSTDMMVLNPFWVFAAFFSFFFQASSPIVLLSFPLPPPFLPSVCLFLSAASLDFVRYFLLSLDFH